MEERFVVCKSDGLYGEYEVVDRLTEKAVVPYAWDSQADAQREARRLNEEL